MKRAAHDDERAAALVACASRARSLRGAVLGADPDRGAVIACILADWLAQVLRDTGTDPREFALRVISDSIRDEAEASS